MADEDERIRRRRVGHDTDGRGRLGVRKIDGSEKSAVDISDEMLEPIVTPYAVAVNARLDVDGCYADVVATAAFSTNPDPTGPDHNPDDPHKSSETVHVPREDLEDLEAALSALAQKYGVEGMRAAARRGYQAHEIMLNPPPVARDEEAATDGGEG